MKMSEVILSHGEETDGTSYPYWCICQKAGLGMIAMLDGIWFNRKDAEDYMKAKAHNYPKTAFVYCFSGCHSWHMKELYAIATQESDGS